MLNAPTITIRAGILKTKFLTLLSGPISHNISLTQAVLKDFYPLVSSLQ